MVILFDAIGAVIVWIVVFKPSLLGTLTTKPIGAILGSLTVADAFFFAVCFFGVALLTRLVEKRLSRATSNKATN